MKDFDVIKIAEGIYFAEKQNFVLKVRYLEYLIREIEIAVEELRFKMSQSFSKILYYVEYTEIGQLLELAIFEFQKIKVETKLVSETKTNINRIQNSIDILFDELFPHSRVIEMMESSEFD